MVKIRLMRIGAKKAPFYRLVIAEESSRRDGRYIENVGYYNPATNPQVVNFKEDRVLYWLSSGATPTETARSLLRRQGLLKRWREAKRPAAGAETPAEA